MARPVRVKRAEDAPLPATEIYERMARHHLALAALFRQLCGKTERDTLDAQQEAPRAPRFIGQP